MDVTKKRKSGDENGVGPTTTADTSSVAETLTPNDARKLLEPFSHEQLLTLLQDAVARYPEVLSAARTLADSDVTRRKLFVRGLGPETTTESLRSLFVSYGELDEAVVITDKVTGKSKGYGFVTYKHVDGALLALKQPSKRIDGRMTVTHLASAGRGLNSEDQATRKIYVGNVPYEISAERLLEYFAQFGDIEEGPLGFDKQGGKLRGFAFFVYKTEEGARMSLMEPTKLIDGHQVMCKLAEDGKKGKAGPPLGPGEVAGDRMSMMGGPNPAYGGPMGNYGSYGLGPNAGPTMGVSAQGPSPVAVGGPGSGGAGGYSAPLGGSYAGSQYGGPASGEFSSYRMPPQNSMGVPPPNSMGMPPTGPYPESGGYGLSSSGYMSQNHPPSQAPPQGPPSGIYQRMPPSYY